MDEQQWYFIDQQEQQIGPISIPQLQELTAQGTITPETQVWTDSLTEWIPASNVEGLFQAPATPKLVRPIAVATTPIIPSTPTTAPITGTAVGDNPYAAPASHPTQAPMYGHYPRPIPKGGSMKLFLILFLGGLAMMLIPLILTLIAAQSAGDRISPSIVFSLLGGSLICFVIGVIMILISKILTYIYLYRAWASIQPGGGTISPGNAVGLLFLFPFSIYWFFIAVAGLPNEWNQVIAGFDNTRMAPRLTKSAALLLFFLPPVGIFVWMSEITKGINFMAKLDHGQFDGPISPAGSMSGTTTGGLNFGPTSLGKK